MPFGIRAQGQDQPFNPALREDDPILAQLLAVMGQPMPQAPPARPLSKAEVFATIASAALGSDEGKANVERILNEQEQARHGAFATDAANRDRQIQELQTLMQMRDLAEQRGLNNQFRQEQLRLQEEAGVRAQEEANRKAAQDAQTEKDKEDAFEARSQLFAAKVKALNETQDESRQLGQELMQSPEAALRPYGRRLLAAIDAAEAGMNMVKSAGEKDPHSINQKILDGVEPWLDDVQKAEQEAVAAQLGLRKQEMSAEAAQNRVETPRPLPPQRINQAEVGQLAKNKNVASLAYQALAEFNRLGKPGGPAAWFGNLTEKQRLWRSYLQRVTVQLKHDIFGSAVSTGEMNSALGYIPTEDAMPDTVENGLLSIIATMQSGWQSKVDQFKQFNYQIPDSVVWDVTPIDVPPGGPPNLKEAGVTQ